MNESNELISSFIYILLCIWLVVTIYTMNYHSVFHLLKIIFLQSLFFKVNKCIYYEI